MTYELCKKLKDAGFLFKRIEGGMCVGNQEVVDFKPLGEPGIGAQHFYCPTLEELIGACGNNVILYISGDDCRVANLEAWDYKRDKMFDLWGIEKSISGKTPSEAVTNLYLALNTK